MAEYFGLSIIILSVGLALYASVMAFQYKQQMDLAVSRAEFEREVLRARQSVYTETAVAMEQAVASVSSGGNYSFDALFNRLTPQLNLHASEEINSCFIEVCLLLENWTAMRDDLKNTRAEIRDNPDIEPQLKGVVRRQTQQENDACQQFQKKFSRMMARMRNEINPDDI